LLCADGFSNADIAAELGVKPHTVGTWRNRFAEHRVAGIEKDLPRSGRPRMREAVESEIIRMTTRETPAHATHWTTRTLAAELDLHLIVDNYATHKHPKVLAWLKRHKRFHIHFIPTSSSWLNVIERFFRDLTDKRLRRGVFRSVPGPDHRD
jgi:transposase